MLYRESVSHPFCGFPRCLKVMDRQNAVHAVQLRYLGTGDQVGSLSSWAGGIVVKRRVLTELGLGSLENPGALDEGGKGQTQVLVQAILSWQIIIQSFSQSITISEIRLELLPFSDFPADSVWCVLGHVGAPIVCNYVKLVDVADMNYFSANNEGEVGRLCMPSSHVQTIMGVGRLYQEAHTIVNRFGIDSFEILSKEWNASEPQFSITDNRD